MIGQIFDFVGRVMVFNATFNNNLAILRQLVLLAEEFAGH
jgi:hypothetical protein